ncbi:accessory gene regulator B family protein [Paenibacillus hexagrammi]|uniref:accessory gene regulator B family protein n=1 Tax=Paenibacillus hexagrammi TaxID=2908839 RepID=UPI003313083D
MFLKFWQNISVSFATTLIISIFTNHIKEALLVILCTILLKMFIGSLHFESSSLCMIYSSLVMIGLTHINIDNSYFNYFIGFLAALSIILYAPKNVRVFFKFKKENFKYLKWLGVLLILLSLVLGNSTIILSFAFYSISISPLFEKLFILLERRKQP